MRKFLQAFLQGPGLKEVLDFIPNPKERKRAAESLERSLLDAVAKGDAAQAEINKIEAGHSSVFVAGWRPFIGWVCGAGIAWSFIGQPVAIWAVSAFGDGSTTLPTIETDGLYQLVLAMLGMGGLRTFEKIKGVARSK